MVCRTIGVSDQWRVGPMVCRTNDQSPPGLSAIKAHLIVLFQGVRFVPSCGGLMEK